LILALVEAGTLIRWRESRDDLAAFMETYLSLKNGITNPRLEAAVQEGRIFFVIKALLASILTLFTEISRNCWA
jgi:hypothetical protein